MADGDLDDFDFDEHGIYREVSSKLGADDRGNYRILCLIDFKTYIATWKTFVW